MGLIIVQKNSNFSGMNLGKIAIPDNTEYDLDALSFFTRINLSDMQSKTALNQMVSMLKAYDLWGKVNNIFPLVGDTNAGIISDVKNLVSQIIPVGPINYTKNVGVTFSADSFFKTSIQSNKKGCIVTSLNNTNISIRPLIGAVCLYGQSKSALWLYDFHAGVGMQLWNMNPVMDQAILSLTKGTIMLNIGEAAGNYIYNNNVLLSENTALLENLSGAANTANKWALGAWLDYRLDPTNIMPDGGAVGSVGTLGIALFANNLNKTECVLVNEIVKTYLTTMGRI